MDPIALSIFANRIAAICDEMGAVLQRAAFSPNIKDRLDFSCAIFDQEGQLCAQAAHIPVHLGSMAFAMRDIVSQLQWAPGDMVILNDPFLGGTHLPDVTLIAPVFIQDQLIGFVTNRAHHADIGASAPGSMPISQHLDEEGVVIPPTFLMRDGKRVEDVFEQLSKRLGSAKNLGDFAAQISANECGVKRLAEWVETHGIEEYSQALSALNDYAERLAQAALIDIPDGEYQFEDVLDDDGMGNTDIYLRVAIKVSGHEINVDFSGTDAQVQGNINCPLSVAAAGVYYVFRCLMPAQTPACAGAFRPISIFAPEGCLLNAKRPAAVAAGNVETSTRVVDVVMGALAKAIPQRMAAASQGSMNNVAMGSKQPDFSWDYYETLGGGMGANPHGHGLSGVQTHMTNTLNTPIESLEMHYPLRIRRYALRPSSGGDGKFCGGNGLVREFEFQSSTTVTLLTERRRHPAWGLEGAVAGDMGENKLNNQILPGKTSFVAKPGDVLSIRTPGGGGWGKCPEINN